MAKDKKTDKKQVRDTRSIVESIASRYQEDVDADLGSEEPMKMSGKKARKSKKEQIKDTKSIIMSVSNVPDDVEDEDDPRLREHNETEDIDAATAAALEDTFPTEKVPKAIRALARDLGRAEVRGLVKKYYQMQNDRIRSDHQLRMMKKNHEGEDFPTLVWISKAASGQEHNVRILLAEYVKHHPVGQWLTSIHGIGPVMAAGLLAYIDIERAPTVGHIWRIAGLDPTSKWLKGQKRPWNADFKKLCYLIGESFVKVGGNPKSFYSQIYLERKIVEWRGNISGRFAAQADEKMANFKIKDADTRAWYTGKYVGAVWKTEPCGNAEKIVTGSIVPIEAKEGEEGVKMLPPGRIHLRAKRVAVKLMIAHLHDQLYWWHYKKAPPLPYPIAIMGHAHYVGPPNMMLGKQSAAE